MHETILIHPPLTKELFIIRHGETDFNLQGIVQGRGVNPGLNETGRKQADLFYKYYQNESFEAVYTSSLLRTHQSVSGFIDQGIPWLQFAELDEISWGIFEGRRASPDFKWMYRELLTKWNEGKVEEKAPGGESPVDVQQRQVRFIQYLLSQPVDKVLICMHGRAMRIFLPTLLEKPLTAMDEFPHHNLTLYKLKFSNGKFTIELFNNMDHLHELNTIENG